MQHGAKVHFKEHPELKGTFRELILSDGEFPESASVDIWIPDGHPDFLITGTFENFWCDPESLIAD